MVLVVVALVLGAVLLAVAPDRFVAGSSGLAGRWGISPVLIGAVVVGFGTSAPEMLVSGIAAARGDVEVGVGNIVGSNMANLSLVLAVAALIGHLTVPRGVLRQEVPLMGAATVLFAVLVQGGLTRAEGALLALGLAAALAILVRSSDGRAGDAQVRDRELAADVQEFLAEEGTQTWWRLAYDTVAGLAGTLAGAHLLVTGAVEVASELDLSGGFVGMTVVALGTSLPELATAIAAARAGEGQLILGNVLGSNLFNCLAVGGLVGLAGPGPLTDAGLTVDGVLLMLAITVLGVAAMARGQLVTRGEAVTLLVAYGAFIPFLSA